MEWNMRSLRFIAKYVTKGIGVWGKHRQKYTHNKKYGQFIQYWGWRYSNQQREIMNFHHHQQPTTTTDDDNIEGKSNEWEKNRISPTQHTTMNAWIHDANILATLSQTYTNFFYITTLDGKNQSIYSKTAVHIRDALRLTPTQTYEVG